MQECHLMLEKEKNISDGSKLIYSEKFILLVHYLLNNKPQYIADSHHEKIQAHDRTDKSNATMKRQITISNVCSFMQAALMCIQCL